MPEIYIHPSLARFVDNQQKISLDIENSEELLSELCKQYPRLRQIILDENKMLNPYVNLYLNGESIKEITKNRVLNHSDEIELVTALAGG
ncbi:MoaD/ThiS family protein [Thiotrichales bacterium 19S9-12]|nr:MoaD/ThiS family protein [Thiotrichales bacterium 19S9-11]MCF6811613.1 MoaD/ThiS family protein [Thiotrichales bacterium 19S9-12]